MKKTQGCAGRATVVTIWLIVVVLVLGVCVFAFLYLRQQEDMRAGLEPPIVLINEPGDGASVTAGRYLPVSASAFSRSPITRLELWLDGELKETEASDQPEGISPFDAHFNPLISQGPHLVFVRAVDRAGIIGQSLPIGVIAEPSVGTPEILVAVPARAGETLVPCLISNPTV